MNLSFSIHRSLIFSDVRTPQTKPLDTFLLVDGTDTRLHQLHLLFLGGDAIFNSGKDPPALC
jgi:hypothetical protein